MDMLVYARCQSEDLGVAFHLSDLKYNRSALYHTLKCLKDEIDKISPGYKAKCIYRRTEYKDINL